METNLVLLGLACLLSTLPTYLGYLPTYLPTCLPTYLPTYLGYLPNDLPTYLGYQPTYLPTYLPTFATYLHTYLGYWPTNLPWLLTYLPTMLKLNPPSRKSNVKSCFLCTRQGLCIYWKSTIRTKNFHRLLWRRPGSETNMKDCWDIQGCSQRCRTL